jgi:hypothetical protein
MLNLIRKDLLVHKTGSPAYLTLIVGVMALQAWRGFSPTFYVILTCVYATILPSMLIAIEDRSCAGLFNCSLPVSRAQIVRAKYALSWALALAATIAGLAVYSVIAANSDLTIWSLSAASQILGTLSIGLGLTLPFVLRFGWIGQLVGFAAAFTAVFIVFLIVLAAFPDLRLVESFIAFTSLVQEKTTQFGKLYSLALVALCGAVLNLISCRIAEMLFERKEF